MDPNIRPKTPYEVADELRREQASDTRHEAIKAMADELARCGFTRDNTAQQVDAHSLSLATAAMLERLIQLGDIGFLLEFETEAPDNFISARYRQIIDGKRTGQRGCATSLMAIETTACDEYAKGFLSEALDMLDSASEIARGRKVDQDIKARKEAAL